MDPNDEFRTPLLTPLTSETTTTNENPSLQQMMFERDYQNSVLDFIREIQQKDDDQIATAVGGYESGNDSDVQDQQPTEAADADPPIHLAKDPVDVKIDESLHSDACPTVVCSSIEEIRPTDENLGAAISDVAALPSEKSPVPSPLMARESYCVPYTNEEGKSLIQDTMTTMIIDYPTVKKGKDDLGHIMISYNHSTRPLCMQIAHALRDRDYIVWIDQDNITGDVLTAMASAVENSFVVLMAMNEQYSRSRYCRLEAEYAVESNKATIPMLMQANYNPAGWLGLIKGAKLYVDFVQFPFDQAFYLLIREIESIRSELGAEKNSRVSSSITSQRQTTSSSTSFSSFRLVQEWTNDDVMEWLHRERLDIFQTVFSHFTGDTLRQLYKIRSECPAHYYQTIESLLDSTVPMRLFHNLTLNSALESLFAPSFSSLSSSTFSFQTKH